MDLRLRDHTVWITGASGGIGRALALAFLSEGARVVLQAGSRVSELEDFARALPGDRILVTRGDVTRADDLERVAERGRSRFGRIDACVANAGIWPARARDLVDLDEARLREVVDVNLIGTLLTCRTFLRAVRDRSGARESAPPPSIVLIGSTAGRFGERGHVEYAASKAALRGVLLTLKNEIAHLDPMGRVNLIEPGWTVTGLTRDAVADDDLVRRAVSTMALRRLATPDDVARLAAFLVSPASAHVTGEAIQVAGGMEGRLLWRDADPAEVRRRTQGGASSA